jgi:large subunit ribosomal protein L15
MMLNEITKLAGRHRRPRRTGRGMSAGQGKTCGRGSKGCLARSGGGPHPLAEGGQMPMFRRLPKRGFSNFNFRRQFETVNITELEKRFADGDTVDPEVLRKLRLIRQRGAPVKVLAKGKLAKELTVEAHAFSETARRAIEGAGGTVRLIEQRDPPQAAKAKRNTAKSRPREAKPTRLEKKRSQRSED